jgi:hypothetical protein
MAERKGAGRPSKYSSPDEMQAAIDAYFEDADAPTMAGLALELGFQDRRSLSDYAEKDNFLPVIKRARTKLEEFHEKNLLSRNPTGSIFWLKNHSGYRDRQELTGANGGPVAIIATAQDEHI